jgi:hypothetical protein
MATRRGAPYGCSQAALNDPKAAVYGSAASTVNTIALIRGRAVSEQHDRAGAHRGKALGNVRHVWVVDEGRWVMGGNVVRWRGGEAEQVRGGRVGAQAHTGRLACMRMQRSLMSIGAAAPKLSADTEIRMRYCSVSAPPWPPWLVFRVATVARRVDGTRSNDSARINSGLRVAPQSTALGSTVGCVWLLNRER